MATATERYGGRSKNRAKASFKSSSLADEKPVHGNSSYKREFAKQAELMTKLGATDRDLAEAFGISIVTINAWKARHPDFLKSLKDGKEHADNRVARALYERAVGYSYETEKVYVHRGEVIRVTVVEHVLPDVTAMIFWLKNRRPDQWREKKEEEDTVNNSLREFMDHISKGPRLVELNERRLLNPSPELERAGNGKASEDN